MRKTSTYAKKRAHKDAFARKHTANGMGTADVRRALGMQV